jgi:hypothetical protein
LLLLLLATPTPSLFLLATPDPRYVRRWLYGHVDTHGRRLLPRAVSSRSCWGTSADRP